MDLDLDLEDLVVEEEDRRLIRHRRRVRTEGASCSLPRHRR